MNNRDRKSFGAMLRNARRARGLSQAALAKAANISSVFVSQIETGQRLPSDHVTKTLAGVLGLQWDDLLRSVYRLRSREAGELFSPTWDASDRSFGLVSEIPALRFLLMQLAGLNLSPRHLEALVRNWTNDVSLITQLGQVEKQ